MNRPLLLSGGQILTMTDDVNPHPFVGWVAVRGNRIELVADNESKVREFLSENPDTLHIDCRGKVVMPGLVNTHCHVSMTLQRNFADDITLMEWLNDHIWPFEARQTGDDIALGAELGIVEMLLGGVTSFVDMYWEENRIATVAERLGIRALLCSSFIDSMWQSNLEDFEKLLPQASQRVRCGVGPHAPYTVSRENLLAAKALCEKHDVWLTIHVAESKAEMESVAQATGMTPVEWLDSLGLLTPKTIAAHCVYVSDSDREILKKRGVKIAHNPTSNMKISSGIAPIASYSKDGLHTSIGTDGCCSNNDLDMWEEMRNASFLSKVSTMDPTTLPAYEVLKMATVWGAEAIGHEGELGIIAQGALADIIIIDIMKPHLQPVNNLISDLVYCCKASDVESVIVDGRVVVSERKIQGVQLGELFSRATEAVAQIRQRCNE